MQIPRLMNYFLTPMWLLYKDMVIQCICGGQCYVTQITVHGNTCRFTGRYYHDYG